MRSYAVAEASFILRAPTKWLDNALSRNPIPGVDQAAEGGDRRISAEALDRLSIARSLQIQFEMAIPTALLLAERVLQEPARRLSLGAGLELHLSHAALRVDLEARAVESGEALRRRRGRPRKTAGK